MTPAQSDKALTRVELFGGPLHASATRRSRSRRTRWHLVALLFGHRDGRISRAEVIWLIWGVDDGPVPRQKLRQLLSDVHERTQTRVVENNADPLQPDASLTSSDLGDFLQSLSSGRFLEAAETLQRGFAAALVPPTEAYADWIEAPQGVARERTPPSSGQARGMRA